MPRGLPPPLALAYHGVADVARHRDPEGLFVSPEDVKRHVERLRSWGYRLESFGVLAAAAAAAGETGDADGLAALTFDDGLVDNLDTLVPLLRELDAPATVFVVSGWLGSPHPAASWTRILDARELRELHASGVEIGAHSATHRDLTKLAFPDALDELERSRRELGAILATDVAVAAYPYGRATGETRRACREAGYRAACRSTGSGSWSDPFDLPRQDMENGAGLLGLRLKRHGRYEPVMRLRPARAVRRVVRGMRAAVR